MMNKLDCALYTGAIAIGAACAVLDSGILKKADLPLPEQLNSASVTNQVETILTPKPDFFKDSEKTESDISISCEEAIANHSQEVQEVIRYAAALDQIRRKHEEHVKEITNFLSKQGTVAYEEDFFYGEDIAKDIARDFEVSKELDPFWADAILNSFYLPHLKNSISLEAYKFLEFGASLEVNKTKLSDVQLIPTSNKPCSKISPERETSLIVVAETLENFKKAELRKEEYVETVFIFLRGLGSFYSKSEERVVIGHELENLARQKYADHEGDLAYTFLYTGIFSILEEAGFTNSNEEAYKALLLLDEHKYKSPIDLFLDLPE